MTPQEQAAQIASEFYFKGTDDWRQCRVCKELSGHHAAGCPVAGCEEAIASALAEQHAEYDPEAAALLRVAAERILKLESQVRALLADRDDLQRRWALAEARTGMLESDLVQRTKERDKYNRALDVHLCPHDKADWLACAGGHGEACQVCAESDHGQHRHALLARAESAEAKLVKVQQREWNPWNTGDPIEAQLAASPRPQTKEKEEALTRRDSLPSIEPPQPALTDEAIAIRVLDAAALWEPDAMLALADTLERKLLGICEAQYLRTIAHRLKGTFEAPRPQPSAGLQDAITALIETWRARASLKWGTVRGVVLNECADELAALRDASVPLSSATPSSLSAPGETRRDCQTVLALRDRVTEIVEDVFKATDDALWLLSDQYANKSVIRRSAAREEVEARRGLLLRRLDGAILKWAGEAGARDTATPKEPNPCQLCGTWLWDDPRPCWNCARARVLALTPPPETLDDDRKDYVDWGSGELLAMTALDAYPIDDGLMKSTSVVFRIRQLVHRLEDTEAQLTAVRGESQRRAEQLDAALERERNR